MPAGNSLKRYIPIAFVIVVALAAFVAANPSLFSWVLDPAGTLARQRERALYAVGSADSPLTAAEARALFDRFTAGEHAAATALAQQDQEHGLPEDFIRDLETALIDGGDRHLEAAYLIEQLALNRPFAARVEGALAQLVHPPTGGTRTQPIAALGNLGAHRALTDSTLTLLLDVALARSSAEQAALAAIGKTAEPFGLPDWALDRLEEIAEERPGSIRSDAIGVIAASGAKERALALVHAPSSSPLSADAITGILSAQDLPQLLATLEDAAANIDLRTAALNQIVQRRDQSELVGRALTYAFSSDEIALRLAAISTYTEWGRHHSQFIDVSWHEVCAEGFADENESMRIGMAGAFPFIPFANVEERDRFLLDMLQGDEAQQLSALRASAQSSLVSEPVKRAVVGLAASSNAEIAAAASMLAEQDRPKGRFEGLGARLAGTAFLVLLLLPAITAVGFETYFVARLLQRIAEGSGRLAATAVSVAWLLSSLALGLLLFMGVLGLGHGGVGLGEINAMLGVTNVVFFGVGWVLSLAVRKRRVTQ